MKRRRLSLNLRVILRALVYVMVIGSLFLVGMPSKEVGGTPRTSPSTISFGPGNDVGGSTANVYSVALGDLDNDGDLDIVSGSTFLANFEVIAWENDGSPFSGLWSQNDVGTTIDSVESVALGDLDNDGDLDIISGSTFVEDYEVIAWENDGSPFSGLWTQNDVGASMACVSSVPLGDLDNDGDLDIISGSRLGQDYKVIAWENDGSPFSDLWSQNDVGASTAGVESVALGDLDGDGDLDIVSGSNSDEDYEVIAWQNDGTPFTDLWSQNDVGASDDSVYSVALGDLDGDGDLDIVSGSGSDEDYEVIAWENTLAWDVYVTPATDAKSGNPGETLTYTLQVTNAGTTSDTFDVAVSGNTWTTTAPATLGPLAAGASQNVDVTVNIPTSAAGGATDVAIITVTSQGDNTQSATSTLTTTANNVYGVAVTPATDAQSGNPGETVTYTLEVTNTGNTSDTFDMAVSGNAWTTTAPATVGPFGAGASQNVDVTVNIPTSAAGGATDVAIITVTSQGDNTQSATSTLTTTANNVYGVAVTPATDAQSGNPGETVTYTLEVTNTGNTSDTFDVAVSGNTWTTTAPATVGPLAAGASGNVVVTVNIPASAAGGATDVATITVTSQGDNTQSATSTLTTTNELYRLFLPIVLKNF